MHALSIIFCSSVVNNSDSWWALQVSMLSLVLLEERLSNIRLTIDN